MNQLKQLINKHEIIEIQKFVRNNCVEIEDVRELLIYALQNKENNRIIEYLIELLNYNLNYYNQEGKVPLFVSLQQKNYYITDKLLKNKADINYIDKNGENVLLYLYHKKVLNEKMLVYLLEKGIDVSYCQQKTDKTFLDYIDEYRNRNFINIILKYFYNNDVEVVLSLILSHKNKWGISNRLLKEIIRYRINPKIKNKLMLLAYHHNNINLLRFL
ncbi:ankyrin repeat-containing domain protein, partial [Neocallimastix sp. 'constans']